MTFDELVATYSEYANITLEEAYEQMAVNFPEHNSEVSILSANMNRSYNGTSKQFGGTVYTHLQHANRIFYRVEGDFYNNGITTFNGGVNLSIDNSGSINFGLSNASNHFIYAYIEGA